MLSAIPDLNEKILQHNSELVSNISRLISEKQEFQNIIKGFRRTTEALKDKEAFSNQVIFSFFCAVLFFIGFSIFHLFAILSC